MKGVKLYHLCCETLSNELRVKIINLLSDKPMSVNEIADKLTAERSRVSHSLYVLKGCNIVSAKKSGKKMIYSLKDKSYLNAHKSSNSVFDIIDSHINTFCNICYKIKR